MGPTVALVLVNKKVSFLRHPVLGLLKMFGRLFLEFNSWKCSYFMLGKGKKNISAHY